MPYIDKHKRPLLDPTAILPPAVNAGELNYQITMLCKNYAAEGRYQEINDVLGALEGAKLEFYRRVAAPYEDGKIKENGDVY